MGNVLATVPYGNVFVFSTIGAILDIVEHSGQCIGYLPYGKVFVVSTIGAILDIVEHSGQCLGYRTVWQRLCIQYNMRVTKMN